MANSKAMENWEGQRDLGRMLVYPQFISVLAAMAYLIPAGPRWYDLVWSDELPMWPLFAIMTVGYALFIVTTAGGPLILRLLAMPVAWLLISIPVIFNVHSRFGTPAFFITFLLAFIGGAIVTMIMRAALHPMPQSDDRPGSSGYYSSSPYI